MFNSVFLDVAIGLIFLFCMMSLGASVLRESIEALLKTRAIMLEYGIRELVGDATRAAPAAGPPLRWWSRLRLAVTRAAPPIPPPDIDVDSSMTKALFDHPQINGLFSGEYPSRLARFWRFGGHKSLGREFRIAFRSNLPSYIPSRNFAAALLDTVARGPVLQNDATPASLAAISLRPLDLDSVRRGIPNLPNPRLQRALLNALDTAGDDLAQARLAVERWYDSGMDRVTGWYRRETQAILFVLGLLLAAALNIDAVAVGQRLLVDKPWRDALIASIPASTAAQPASDASPAASDASPSAADSGTAPKAASLPELEAALQSNGFMLNAPLRTNWSLHDAWPGCTKSVCTSTKLGGFLEALPGYLIVALATSLGAPFWFDLLSKLMTVRSTMKPPEKAAAPASGASAPRDPPQAPPAGQPAPVAAVLITDPLLALDPNERPREDYPPPPVAPAPLA